VSTPAALALILFGRPILTLWTGDPAFAERTWPLVRLLAAGTYMHTLMFLPYMLQLACGWPGLAVRVNAVAVVVLVPALLLLVPRYGAVAAAGVWVALNTGYLAYTVRATHLRLLPGEAGRWYARDVGLPLMCGAAAALALSLLPFGLHGRLADLAMLASAAPLVLFATLAGSPFGAPILGWLRQARARVHFR